MILQVMSQIATRLATPQKYNVFLLGGVVWLIMQSLRSIRVELGCDEYFSLKFFI